MHHNTTTPKRSNCLRCNSAYLTLDVDGFDYCPRCGWHDYPIIQDVARELAS